VCREKGRTAKGQHEGWPSGALALVTVFQCRAGTLHDANSFASVVRTGPFIFRSLTRYRHTHAGDDIPRGALPIWKLSAISAQPGRSLGDNQSQLAGTDRFEI